ncbi:MAG TPA: FAA hydrolase family protein [Thermoplasmatales archaeon]|nr:FAA hydrolase family protein [Thermoplasmatales archaeon]
MLNYIFEDGAERNIPIGKLVCLARTYKKHADEMKSKVPEEPLLFLKPVSSVIFDGESIVYPSISKCLHHEVELGVVIGKKCKDITRDTALDCILGYCVCLDITARDIQSVAKKNGWPWSIAKGFDTFAPISNIVLKERCVNPNNLDISLKVNGTVRQSSNTKNMVFSVEEIIEFISSIMTLEPGDLIMTGTPEGVGEIHRGDVLEAELGGICFLKVDVK